MQKTFNEKCYDILRKVPKGRVTTYKEIAGALKSKGYRAVGNAMNKNPRPGSGAGRVPCHRVVKSSGEIGGFAHGTKKKIEMLRKEGVEVKDGRIDLKRYLYKF